MSDNPRQHPPHDPTQDPKPPTPDIRLRLWPAVLIVLVNLAVTGAAFLFASNNFHYLIGFAIPPLLAALLLIVWWLAASRAPVRDRIVGVALFLLVLLLLASSQKNGYLILLVAVPCIATGVVAALLFAPPFPWRVRRLLAVNAMLAICAVFLCVRVEGMSGHLLPAMSWRWTPKAEDLLAVPQLDSAGPGKTAELPPKLTDHDWPGFRGPARDGRVLNTTFATNWIEHPPHELWRRPIGLGWSSFAVVGGYAFTQEQRGDHEVVVCYDADNGSEVWINRLPVRFEDNTGSGPRATPTYHDRRLYTLGATGILQCLDAANGSTIWKCDLVQDTGARLPEWGFTSSPLIVDNLVAVFVGGGSGKGLAAYDRLSGQRAWLAGQGSHGYSSPHFAHIAGVPQILMASDFGLQSFEPDTGQLLWQDAWDLGGHPRVVQPLLIDAHSLIYGSSYGKGSRRLHIEKSSAPWTIEQQWTDKRFRPHFNDLVYHNGYCYGFSGSRFTCIDAATGERQWAGARYGGQALLIPDIDTLLVLTEAGAAVLLQATPQQDNQIARLQALNAKTWNHPVIAHGRLFVRNAEEAACYQLP